MNFISGKLILNESRKNKPLIIQNQNCKQIAISIRKKYNKVSIIANYYFNPNEGWLIYNKHNSMNIVRIKNTMITDDDTVNWAGNGHGIVKQSIIIPSTKEKNLPISKEELNIRVNKVAKFLSEKFGGFTEIKANGGWTSDDGEIIKENNVQLISYSNIDTWTKENQREMIDFIRNICKEWSQDAIAYEIEDDMFFLKPEE